MKKFCTAGLFVIGVAFYSVRTYSQDASLPVETVLSFPDKAYESLSDRAGKLKQKILSAAIKRVAKLHRKKTQLQAALWKKDSLLAQRAFSEKSLEDLNILKRLNSDSPGIKSRSVNYVGRLDSVRTAMKFLLGEKEFPLNIGSANKMSSVLKQYNELQEKLDELQDIQQRFAERRRSLEQVCERLGSFKALQRYKKQVYYFRAQVEDCKEMLKSPSKVEQKLLQYALRLPSFAKFFNKYSALAGLFRLPGNDDLIPTGISGLQTRSDVMSVLQQRLGSGIEVDQMLASNISYAKSKLNTLKEKLSAYGGSGSDADMPDFKANSQKTKKFFQRLELGANIQSTKSSNFFPITSDLGLSAGYRFTSFIVSGLGASYKIGWGKDIHHIRMSRQGMGIRSFVDVKLKREFWIAGAAEWNYRDQFYDFADLNRLEKWQNSALLGVSKKSALKKVKTNVQLLYDFLYNKKFPAGPPLVFRFGYTLK